MHKTTKRWVIILLTAILLLAVLAGCGKKDKKDENGEPEPAETAELAQTVQGETVQGETVQGETVLWGDYTCTEMITRGESVSIEPMHLTVNEDGSGLMWDNSGTYNVTFYFEDGTGIISERQTYFTFSQDGDSLVLVDGQDIVMVFEPDA